MGRCSLQTCEDEVIALPTALATIKPQALTSERETALATILRSGDALAKMPGTGGEVARQEGVTRVTGRDYATSAGTLPASEIYFVDGAKPREEGVWLGEANKVTWIDTATGYECIVMRDNPDGFLSGYVGVPASHPLFGWEHDAIPTDLGVEVHGGLSIAIMPERLDTLPDMSSRNTSTTFKSL